MRDIFFGEAMVSIYYHHAPFPIENTLYIRAIYRMEDFFPGQIME